MAIEQINKAGGVKWQHARGYQSTMMLATLSKLSAVANKIVNDGIQFCRGSLVLRFNSACSGYLMRKKHSDDHRRLHGTWTDRERPTLIFRTIGLDTMQGPPQVTMVVWNKSQAKTGRHFAWISSSTVKVLPLQWKKPLDDAKKSQ